LSKSKIPLQVTASAKGSWIEASATRGTCASRVSDHSTRPATPFPAAKNRFPLTPAKFAKFAKFAIFAKFANFGRVDALHWRPALGRQR
jgi:hypothetical protein